MKTNAILRQGYSRATSTISRPSRAHQVFNAYLNPAQQDNGRSHGLKPVEKESREALPCCRTPSLGPRHAAAIPQ